MRKALICILGAGLLAVGVIDVGSGQIFRRQRVQPNVPRDYTVKIVSQFGIPATVGIFGKQTDATFRVSFDGGRTGPDVYTAKLIGGERVVCVWDRRGSLLYIAELLVDSAGTLEIPGEEGGEPGRAHSAPAGKEPTEGAARAAVERPDLPRLKIRQ